MDSFIKELLLNLLFVLLPLFLYQTFWTDRVKFQINWVIIGLLGAASGILCMTFPVRPTPGFLFDLRLVPMIGCFMYGGMPTGLLAGGIMVAYRYYLGVSYGAHSSLITFSIIALLSLVLRNYYRKLGTKNQILSLLIASVLCAALVLFLTTTFNPALAELPDFVPMALFYVGMVGVSMLLLALTIDTIRRNKILREMLIQAKKNEVAGELAASVSHEVRNPLTATRGFLQLLRKNTHSPEKQAGFIDIALEELQRAESIITDYLNFAKPQLEAVETLDVAVEIKYVADVISPYAAMQQVGIECRLDGSPRIQGDRDKFRQCLLNLAKNAVEAMPDGGMLSFQASRIKGKVEVSITDNGVGMTQEQVGRLGSPYYSTKDKGTGLGTMVVYSMIKAMGGTVDVTSSPGGGTVFRLRLPELPE